ncbi:MAG: phosphoadenylyl-sulfate reductase [Alphaproteobacteria bacterium]|nr:phosphoadenylyl-sulfate reductase [Alphaproteobacteria bacterium]
MRAPFVTERLHSLTHLREALGDLSLDDRLKRVRAAIPGRIVLTTSFGIEDQALCHAVFSLGLEIDVVTLDTGRLFPETYSVWAETEARYDRRIRAFYPRHDALEAHIDGHGINGFYASVENRKACCEVRKVEPLARALDGAEAWITGLRADQSSARSAVDAISHDPARGLIKINPLYDWDRPTVVEYVKRHAVPYNQLHDKGYLSIGCQPCTRALEPGEPERAGRWWWEADEKKECGLHVAADGRLVRRSA